MESGIVAKVPSENSERGRKMKDYRWILVLTEESKRLRKMITAEKTKSLGEMRKRIPEPHV